MGSQYIFEQSIEIICISYDPEFTPSCCNKLFLSLLINQLASRSKYCCAQWYGIGGIAFSILEEVTEPVRIKHFLSSLLLNFTTLPFSLDFNPLSLPLVSFSFHFSASILAPIRWILFKLCQAQWFKGSEMDLYPNACTMARVRFVPLALLLQYLW